MDNKRLQQLFGRLHNNKCSESDIAELNNWYHSLNEGEQELKEWFRQAGGEEQLAAQLYTSFTQKVKQRNKVIAINRFYRVAAAVLVFVIGGLFFYNRNTTKPAVKVAAVVNKPIQPGKNNAMLTLADGSKISLTDARNGDITTQAGVKISKAADGKLRYTVLNTAATDANKNAYNTIETPRAGQYEVMLPDGSKVWLNAESSLKYPVSFTKSERRVELTGEAYFEVAHNKASPFKVTTGGQTVTVLGTHFNIKGYHDEDNISTTLLQGSVMVSNNVSKKTKMLVPGKQADIIKGEGGIALSNANIDQVMAWKNGYFVFDNKDIKSIMKLISRWYDVDVDYNLKKADVRFGGTFSRSSNLTDLLNNLQLLGDIHFKLKERRITVSN